MTNMNHSSIPIALVIISGWMASCNDETLSHEERCEQGCGRLLECLPQDLADEYGTEENCVERCVPKTDYQLCVLKELGSACRNAGMKIHTCVMQLDCFEYEELHHDGYEGTPCEDPYDYYSKACDYAAAIDKCAYLFNPAESQLPTVSY